MKSHQELLDPVAVHGVVGEEDAPLQASLDVHAGHHSLGGRHRHCPRVGGLTGLLCLVRIRNLLLDINSRHPAQLLYYIAARAENRDQI